MNKGILVDTSMWIEYFKNNTEITSFMEKNMLDDNIYINGIIVAELLQGLKNDSDRKIIQSNLNAVSCIDLEYDDWVSAGELSRTLRKNGVTLPLTDIAIATTALRNNLQVSTYDKHFKLIPGIELNEPVEKY